MVTSVLPGGKPVLKEMKSYCHLKPGQNGTKRLVEQYGKALLCVRYRYDAERHVKIKTVELIIEKRPAGKSRLRDDDVVAVHVAFEEAELRQLLRKVRGTWDPKRKQWFVTFGLIRGTPLEARIVEG
jgi:hypothetical protein